MRIIDVVLVLLVAAAGVRGYYRGALLQLASYGGMLAGIFAAGILVILLEPVITNWSPTWRALTALVIFVLLLAVGETAGFALGRRIKRRLRSRSTSGTDRILGFPVAGVATLLLLWLLAGIFIASPLASAAPAVSYDIRQSKILRATSQALPVGDDVMGPLRRFLTANRLPLPLPPFESPDAPPVVIDPALAGSKGVARASKSVFVVRGAACGQQVEGSAWVASPGYLVTNAHVVAGMAEPRVIQGPRSLAATVTYFDPSLDLAVLRVPGIQAEPLALAGGDPAPRTQGATIGFPGGGSQVIAAAAVRTTASTRTADIYGYPGVIRELVFFAGEVKPGNSGGPLVNSDGVVIGVVFATALAGSDDDYALAPSAVREPIINGTSASKAVSTGRCA
ncbi:MAG: hypothetical protein DCC49_08070 [Acidobacteria bacterium]|nr:MAG: hypothetical protein DCC49_08070 [Acidobacteriota bacterium]